MDFRYHAWTRTTVMWVAITFSIYGVGQIIDGAISPWWLVVAYGVNQVFMFTMSVGNHRLISHRGFECSKFWEYFFAITSVIGGDDSSYGWAHTHRVHHRFADKPRDPYDTHLRYFFQLRVRNVPPEIPRMKWMMRDPVHRYTHKYAALIVVLFGAALWLLSPSAFLIGYMLPLAWHLITGGLLIIYTHKNGEAIDRPWYWGIFFPAAGEWYHAKHHVPGKAIELNNATKPGQLDSGYWFCRLIAKKGSIKDKTVQGRTSTGVIP